MTSGEPTRPVAGSSSSEPRRARPATSPNDDDVLERLARLGGPAEPTNATEVVGAAGSAGTAVVDGVVDRSTDGESSPVTSSVEVAESVLPPIIEAEPLVPNRPAEAPPAELLSMPTPAVDLPTQRAAVDTTSTGTVSTGATVTPRVRSMRPVGFHRRRPRVRRVTRVVRHVDTWSVFKVALVFNAVLYLVCLVAGVLLWNVATATGTIDNVEQFFEQFGWESFEFNGGQLYHNFWIAGLFLAVGLTGVAVLGATVFNLITDLVGGIRVSVLEEEVVAREVVAADREGNVRSGPG